MTTIKLDHTTVMSQLKEMENALKEVVIEPFDAASLGDMKLAFTDIMLQREESIHRMAKEYIEAVSKNIEDTKANVTSLKEQDEAITHS
ncbi:hypothetical protein CEF21_20815 [Bacillus sp. FJAT-42376]|uniref:DUF5344 family protein n=1 Tax=Bacillus sp. FJAT-42376 TaxID=2014076 RepID=UPI000F4FEDAA|nr:DUF5344 family protein [Bacillus sp. FJAT-42376]AZB44988.1 hypothetical protein CEF21_20815 [Bacillus sp. FJAT-42376]